MKSWVLSLIFAAMLSLFIAVDTQAHDNIFFLANIDVASGNYYLIYKDLRNRDILYDDPNRFN